MSAPVQILLVDDDEAITSSLSAYLRRNGFTVRTSPDGLEALEAVEAATPDLVICDVMMPRLDGREFVRRMRARRAWVPIILLTQVGDSGERSVALDEGADDYLNKPFDPLELVSRMRAVLRRNSQGTTSLSAARQLRSRQLRLDRTARRAWLLDREINLTPKAFALLDFLMTHPDEAHSRERLLSTLWGFDFESSSRAVDHRIRELRRELGDDPSHPRFIDTAQGHGYRFIAQVDAE